MDIIMILTAFETVSATTPILGATVGLTVLYSPSTLQGPIYAGVMGAVQGAALAVAAEYTFNRTHSTAMKAEVITANSVIGGVLGVAFGVAAG